MYIIYTIFWILFFPTFIYFCYWIVNRKFNLSTKDQIFIELDTRYYGQQEIRDAAIKYLENQGKKCEVIDLYTILVDKTKYLVHETNGNMGHTVPVQYAVLKRVLK